MPSTRESRIASCRFLQVLKLARCEWIDRREIVIALGPSGAGKTHVALGLGLAACRKGMSVGFPTAAALINELTLKDTLTASGCDSAIVTHCPQLLTDNVPYSER